jgi:hypothetical protein
VDTQLACRTTARGHVLNSLSFRECVETARASTVNIFRPLSTHYVTPVLVADCEKEYFARRCRKSMTVRPEHEFNVCVPVSPERQ